MGVPGLPVGGKVGFDLPAFCFAGELGGRVCEQTNPTAKSRLKAQQKISELQSLLSEHKQASRERELAIRYHKVSHSPSLLSSSELPHTDCRFHQAQAFSGALL